ncbi:MAG TPA: PAS domain-containing protein, partial [Stenomitos sp.]
EAELFRSQQLREAIFNELSDALFLVDPETRQILDCNWRAVELFEAPAREALIGLRENTLRRQQSSDPEFNNVAAEVHSKGVWSRELEYLTLQEHPFWGNIAAKPIMVADNTLNLVRVTDISDRKRVESQLRNLSDRLALAIKSGAIGIWDWNIPENTLEWDDRMLEMYGITRDQFGSVYEAWTTCLHPEDRTATEAAIQQALEGQKDYDLQFRIIRPDGNIRFIQASALVQRNSQGEPQRMAGINYDITERKQAEFTIQKTAAQLAATNRELESFSYSVSHDLRAPLRHMSGFVNALHQQLEQQGALDNPKVVHYLNVIHNSSQKMGQLIDGLLSLSRLGRRPMNWQQVSIRELVEEAIALTQLEGTETSTPVEFAIGNLPAVMGDATLLQQVFRNLIENATKFSRNSPNPRIEIDSTSDGTIWVKDNGAGFQMEYADKLFGAFQRLHSQSEFEGLGIGLAIVQRIVQRHGGTIWAEAKLNEGATFYVNFNNQDDMIPLSS